MIQSEKHMPCKDNVAYSASYYVQLILLDVGHFMVITRYILTHVYTLVLVFYQ